MNQFKRTSVAALAVLALAGCVASDKAGDAAAARTEAAQAA